jgi:hypothetical protein
LAISSLFASGKAAIVLGFCNTTNEIQRNTVAAVSSVQRHSCIHVLSGYLSRVDTKIDFAWQTAS